MKVPTCLRGTKGNGDKGSVQMWCTVWVLPKPNEVVAAGETRLRRHQSEAGSQASGRVPWDPPCHASVVTPQEVCVLLHMGLDDTLRC